MREKPRTRCWKRHCIAGPEKRITCLERYSASCTMARASAQSLFAALELDIVHKPTARWIKHAHIKQLALCEHIYSSSPMDLEIIGYYFTFYWRRPATPSAFSHCEDFCIDSDNVKHGYGNQSPFSSMALTSSFLCLSFLPLLSFSTSTNSALDHLDCLTSTIHITDSINVYIQRRTS